MLKELSTEIYKDSIVALSRYVEMALLYFNSFAALMLLTASWYQVDNAVEFPAGSGCIIPAGTVIEPFLSKFCEKELTTLVDGGSDWERVRVYVWVYFAFVLLASALIGYEVVTHGIREWKNANIIGFLVQLVLIIAQALILTTSDSAPKPDGVDNSTARILIILALSLSIVRIVVLGVFMYVTRKYIRPYRGAVGTGSYI